MGHKAQCLSVPTTASMGIDARILIEIELFSII